MAIPPGISQRDWTTALQQFRQAVGAAWVFSSDDDIALYRDAYSPLWGEPEERLVSAAVAPDTAEQVSQVVRTANRFKIPLFPISTGKNLGYGGSAPNLSGSVVVDLKRLNRVIEVDDKRHFAIVEPGVAYFDLYRHIQDRGLKVWIDCPDPGWGSPVGNSLDHGVGYTFGAFRDHFHSHCGMEVVLPNGDIVRTGMGALPGAKTWAEYRYGFGPTVDGLFAQGAAAQRPGRRSGEAYRGQRNPQMSGRTRPLTGAEYLESVRDGREIWIYGERVRDVTTHPAFRNTVRTTCTWRRRPMGG